MKVVVLCITYNCVELAPFFLRHYETIADEIAIFDDASTDGTRRIFEAHPKVKLRDWPHPGSGIDETLFLDFIYATYPTAANHGFDWVIVVDSDEFIYAPNVRGILLAALACGIDVIQTYGMNMLGPHFPIDDGRQIWEIHRMGMPSGVYSKPCVLRPGVKVRWSRGRHHLEQCDGVISERPLLKLLHYRYLGFEYTRRRNARNFERCGMLANDKGAAWSCAPDYRGEHSAAWAGKAARMGMDVVSSPL